MLSPVNEDRNTLQQLLFRLESAAIWHSNAQEALRQRPFSRSARKEAADALAALVKLENQFEKEMEK